MLYSKIALALHNISSAPRNMKAALVAGLIKEVKEHNQDMLCPTVRLLLGELWPPWEKREMGIGTERLSAAIAEVSEANVPRLRERLGDMGLVAEASLAEKGQHSLSNEPLQAIFVYEQLRRISGIQGKDSEQRKNAILRGLLLEATPLEGRYIARTILGNTLAGIGHKTMLAAFRLAFHCQPDQLQRAYSLLPDPGAISMMALGPDLNQVAIRPGIPVRPMRICSGKSADWASGSKAGEKAGPKAGPKAILPRYHGLRVQVHKTEKEVLIFSSRLRNITSSLNGLAQRLSIMDGEFIADADLIGFYKGRICRQPEMVRYINRRQLSRRSSISTALIAYDLISLSGNDLTCLPYLERRRKLLEVFGEPKSIPFRGVSTALEWTSGVDDSISISGYLQKVKEEGSDGLIVRSLESTYLPGECSREDFLIGAEESISAVIIRGEYGGKGLDRTFSRFRVALRSDDDLVPVGWIGSHMIHKDAAALDRRMKTLAVEANEQGADVTAQVVVNLRIRGLRKIKQGYSVFQPVVEGIDLFASWEDADELERLLEIYGR